MCHASEVKFTVVFSLICVIRWPSIRNLYIGDEDSIRFVRSGIFWASFA